MPRKEKSFGQNDLHSESLPNLPTADAVASMGGSGVNINLTINNPGANGPSTPSIVGMDGGSLADHTFGGHGGFSRSGTAGNDEIIEVARGAGHKKRRGNMKAGDKQKNLATEYSAVGGFDATACRTFLAKHSWPPGLQEAMVKSCMKMPVRFFITDDSGSMLTNDGNRIVGSKANNKKLIKCTRWSELTQSLRFMAELSEACHAPSEFRLLNNAEPVLVGKNDDEGAGLALIQEIFSDSPGGQTPICAQIEAVVMKIKEMEDTLRNSNQTAAVVICTDGVSTDGDVATAMKPLQELPVWVVVRLCTDDEELIEYWNNIDGELELEMDVLDDIKGEAIEVRTANRWLNYGESLHRLREFGAAIKEMDLIDEALLSSEQMAVVVSCLTHTGNVRDLPHPDEDWDSFVKELKKNQPESQWIYDPIDAKAQPWINMKELVKEYSGNKGSTACNIV